MKRDMIDIRQVQLGQIVATPAALRTFTQEEIMKCLSRHTERDWGDVCEEDRGANDCALEQGGRLLSVYKFPGDPARMPGDPGRVLWIITEWDRSVTTALLPEDY